MKLTLRERLWRCGDGCCSEYWVDLFVDGNLVDERFSSASTALVFVLEKLLGHTIEEVDDGDLYE